MIEVDSQKTRSRATFSKETKSRCESKIVCFEVQSKLHRIFSVINFYSTRAVVFALLRMFKGFSFFSMVFAGLWPPWQSHKTLLNATWQYQIDLFGLSWRLLRELFRFLSPILMFNVFCFINVWHCGRVIYQGW